MTELLLELIIILAGNDKSVDTSKSRDQMVICLKTLKGFKSFLTIVAGFKNKMGCL